MGDDDECDHEWETMGEGCNEFDGQWHSEQCTECGKTSGAWGDDD